MHVTTVFSKGWTGGLVGLLTSLAWCPADGQPREFPLIDQTWVFVNGPTEDTHIVESISSFSASTVIVARFNGDGTADLRYANLQGRYFRSTTEALAAVEQGLRLNVLRQSKLFEASRQPFPDTAYSCDAELARLSSLLRYNGYFINGESVNPRRPASEWQWFYDPPECHATRPATLQDREGMELCQNGWCTHPIEDPAQPAQEACKEDFTECRYAIEEGTHKVKGSTRFFWNLHLFPKIIFHPRQHITGRIIKEESLSEEEALAMRQRAIDNPRNEDMKPYLNPVLDDSLSVYFSGQFLGPSGAADGVWSLSLDIPAEGEGATGYSHDPPAAFRIASLEDWAGLRKALLLPFAESEEEKEFLSNLDSRCPGWIQKDRWIGEQAFTVREGLAVTLPDVLPPETVDPSWRWMKQERVQVEGGYQVRTVVVENRVLNGQKALVRNMGFPYGDYFWKGCPDWEEGTPRVTKAQAVRFLARPVSTCNLATLAQAQDLYLRLGMRFRSPNEQEERVLANKRAEEAQFQYNRTKDKERPEGLRCPESPLDHLVRRLP
jgi:hypothetical protein